VSAPLVISKKLSKTNNLCQEVPLHAAESEEEASNPISSTEEKVPGTNNLVEEYLHNTAESNPDAVNNRLDYASHEAVRYTAFHGELLVPPPNPC
jgi:hypothetical protein